MILIRRLPSAFKIKSLLKRAIIMEFSQDTNSKPPKSKVYTRTGDKGTTSLFTGQRVPKTSPLITALGNNDELTSCIGVSVEFCKLRGNLDSIVGQLLQIQCWIQELNSNIASPGVEKLEFDHENKIIGTLEGWIDELDSKNPPLTRFILPGGGLESAHLHMTRSVCRRAERSLYQLFEMEQCKQNVPKFMNRLSDYFFVASRFVCHFTGHEEVPYRNRPKP